MTSLDVRPLQEGLSFGARIGGVTFDALEDQANRDLIVSVFEDRGMIVFEDVERSGRMHVELSRVFGPLKDHPVAQVPRAGEDLAPGVIDMTADPERNGVIEIDGKPLTQWLPWHFDHCYNNELNRAGVLRAIDIPEEGGLTGFADGIALYEAFSPELRARIEGLEIIYTLDLAYTRMRFGRPDTFRELKTSSGHEEMRKVAATMPRAIHPAVWTRTSGEKVMHVSPWMSVGIVDHEDAAGDALLEAVCQEVLAKVTPYHHKWSPSDMLIWDNWRMLHSVNGHDPAVPRRMQRTTIRGDYGVGRFENGGVGGKILEMTV